MLRRGYIERQVEALSEVLHRLFGLNRENDYEAVLQEIRASGRRLTGLDTAALNKLSDASLLAMLSTRDTVDAGKALAGGVLLDEMAQLMHEQGDIAGARAAWHRSLVLLAEALRQEEQLRTREWIDRADRVRRALTETPPPAS